MRTTGCKGISLIALMLGVAIGLGVMLAACMAYQAQRQSWGLMQATQALLHNANAALDHLHTSIQSANAVILQSALDGSVSRMALPEPNWAMTEGNARSDGLMLSHFSTLDRDDCQGNHADQPTHIRDSYQVNTKLELTCKDIQRPGSTYQAIAEGVEDFQLQFAERLPSFAANSAPSWQWHNANQIQANPQVMAIAICLRMVSMQQLHERVAAPAVTVLGCQGEPLPNDGKLRRVLRRVFAVRSSVAVDTP